MWEPVGGNLTPQVTTLLITPAGLAPWRPLWGLLALRLKKHVFEK